VLGDAVNLASRLEGAAKHYHATIVISETTRAAVPEMACRELDRVRVKGRAQPVTLFEPLGLAADLDDAVRQALAEQQQALAAYRVQQWAQAQAAFAALAQAWPQEPLYSLYLQRIAALQATPPGESWDGVFNLTDK